jgi:ABC-2 type transport system ATP-binding protein
MAELRRRHRIRAQLKGPLPPVPDGLNKDLSIDTDGGGRITIETLGELSPLLQWLSNAPLEEMTVEPVGLRTLYDRLHDEGVTR